MGQNFLTLKDPIVIHQLENKTGIILMPTVLNGFPSGRNDHWLTPQYTSYAQLHLRRMIQVLYYNHHPTSSQRKLSLLMIFGI